VVVDLFRDKFKSGKIINKLDLEKQKEGKLKNSRLFNSWMGEIGNKKNSSCGINTFRNVK
jgi:hypothetical protein